MGEALCSLFGGKTLCISLSPDNTPRDHRYYPRPGPARSLALAAITPHTKPSPSAATRKKRPELLLSPATPKSSAHVVPRPPRIAPSPLVPEAIVG
jgi:hypothetical protein